MLITCSLFFCVEFYVCFFKFIGQFFLFFFKIFIYLFIYWLRWVFVAVRGLLIAVASLVEHGL